MTAPGSMTGKRKRDADSTEFSAETPRTTIQIVTGSYERVLHGLTASIDLAQRSDDGSAVAVTFRDTFLFHAHASSIRSLALSPQDKKSETKVLATGGSDERINLYQLSTIAPHPSTSTGTTHPPSKKAAANAVPSNRELGNLIPHASAVTSLHFPSRGKLISASLDNTISITRMRDWTPLTTIKAPVPKPAGRPSGDTAAPGEVPAGINDIAVHPSAKLCISVGQGERCIRLWNLVTGKKAGVLTFDKAALTVLGETRWRGGEGQKVAWSSDGEELAVMFERGVIVYGLDCQIKGVARVERSKVCQVRYIPSRAAGEQVSKEAWGGGSILVLSTDDGRLLFYNTRTTREDDLATQNAENEQTAPKKPGRVEIFEPLGEIRNGPQRSRVKDFQLLFTPLQDDSITLLVITVTSDGTVSIWDVNEKDLIDMRSRVSSTSSAPAPVNGTGRGGDASSESKASQTIDVPEDPKANSIDAASVTAIAKLVGRYECRRRLTCVTAFIMQGSDRAEEAADASKR